jgi:hypothetical protein
MANTDKQINAAVPLYIGYGITSSPKPDGSRLAAEFGSALGLQLESDVKLLLHELGQLKPDWNSQNLISATKWASGELKRKHPELDSKAIAALEWIYSWGWK